MKKILIALCMLSFITIAIAINPISIGRNPKMKSGKISKIYEAGVKDIVLELHNDTVGFYINRGSENYTNQQLQDLIGKNVMITYSDSWTPLDPLNKRSKSIDKLEVDKQLFFRNK